jgi:hypothetical protein
MDRNRSSNVLLINSLPILLYTSLSLYNRTWFFRGSNYDERMFHIDLTVLITTIVTANAAIVAIVAGFLINRVLSLSVEKSQLVERLQEITEELSPKRTEHDDAKKKYNWDVAKHFIFEHMDMLVLRVMDFKLLIRSDKPFYNANELEPFIKEFYTVIDDHNEIMRQYGSSITDWTTFSQHSFAYSGERSSFYYLIAFNLLNQNLMSGDWQDDPDLQAEVDLQLLQDSLAILKLQIDIDKLEKDRVNAVIKYRSKPDGLWTGMILVLYISIVGIGWPCSLLPYEVDTYNDLQTKWVMLSFFFSALLFLAIYLLWFSYRLARSLKPDKIKY